MPTQFDVTEIPFF